MDFTPNYKDLVDGINQSYSMLSSSYPSRTIDNAFDWLEKAIQTDFIHKYKFSNKGQFVKAVSKCIKNFYIDQLRTQPSVEIMSYDADVNLKNHISDTIIDSESVEQEDSEVFNLSNYLKFSTMDKRFRRKIEESIIDDSFQYFFAPFVLQSGLKIHHITPKAVFTFDGVSDPVPHFSADEYVSESEFSTCIECGKKVHQYPHFWVVNK